MTSSTKSETKAGWTPGPWAVSPNAPNGVMRGSFFVGVFQRPEDALLGAAAPDLYEFARQIVNAYQTQMLDSPADETLANVMRRGVAALARAEGR